MLTIEEQRQRLEEMAKRGREYLSAGYNVNTADLLKQICFVLHGIVLNDKARDADRITAAEALYRIMFGKGSPIHLIEVKT